MMNWLSRLPIRGKLLLLTTIVACVALLVSGAVLVSFAHEASSGALKHRLETQARIMALNSSAALAFDDEAAADSTLNALSGDSAIVAAVIERSDGSVFVERTYARQSLDAVRARTDIEQVSAEIVLDERIGTVRIWASTQELDALLIRALVILAFSVLVALGIALLAASRLQTIISGPIMALADAAQTVSRTRNYALRVPLTGQDEVGALVVAFNDMLSQIDLRNTELRAYQQELESKVASRTAELASALKNAQAAAQAKADFLANMSHEIRTPMNGVIGMLELMEPESLDQQRRTMLETARNSAESLLGIINDVLDFSKIDAGKLTLENIDVELLPLAEEVATLFARQAHANGVEVTCLVDPAVPALVRGDPIRLRQIMSNLLGNAVKFTEHGEVGLTIRTAPGTGSDARIEIVISDTGIGMKPEVVAGLFQSFTQADTSTTRKFGGTGLGLAITKRLVEAMHGTIEVASESGRGSQFTVTLDMQVTMGLPKERRADLGALKVLLVDDNAMNRFVLERYLTSMRVKHQSAASAEAGLAAVRAAASAGQPFDIVLLDYQMPRIDGVGFLRTLRQDPAIAATKCIMLSSAGDRQAGLESLDIAAWLSKPVRQAQLYSAVAMVGGVSAGWKAIVASNAPVASAANVTFQGRVLLVEDNLVNVQVASRLLAALGLEPRVVNSGIEALEITQAEEFDLVLMDCQMPGMDGYQATRAIRTRELLQRRKRMPIVAMTANAMQGDRERCLEAGMDDYISKPVKRDNLAGALSRWLTATSTSPHADGPKEPVMTNQDVLDATTFQQLCELFDGDVSEVIKSYLQDTAMQLETIVKAVEREDAATVGRSAHSLKASSRSIGALGLGQLAEHLEQLMRSNGPFKEAQVLAAQLRQTYASVEPRLRRACEEQMRRSA